MAISIRLSEQDSQLIKDYADLKGFSVSELVRRSVIERIEDEIDLGMYYKAKEQDDGTRYTHEAVKELLNL